MEITIRVLSTFELDFSSNESNFSVTCFCIYTKLLKKKYNAPLLPTKPCWTASQWLLSKHRVNDEVWIVHSNLHILMCADRVVDLTDKDIIYKSALENTKEENIFAVCLRIIVWMIYDVSIVCIIVRKWICFTKKIKRKYPSLISYIYLYGICKAHILVTHQKKRLIFLRFIIPFLRKTVWGTINSSWS